MCSIDITFAATKLTLVDGTLLISNEEILALAHFDIHNNPKKVVIVDPDQDDLISELATPGKLRKLLPLITRKFIFSCIQMVKRVTKWLANSILVCFTKHQCLYDFQKSVKKQ
jgi:hypothetical protein